MKEELEFNKEEEYFDLEELITEGTDAKVPITIEFPDGRKSKALIKPLLAEDMKKVSFNQVNPYKMMITVLKMCLLNSKGEPLPNGLINALPANLPMEICEEIFKISGIETNPEDAGQLKQYLESFLES